MEHTGIHKRRLNEHNPHEVAFADTWRAENEENERDSFRLQDLMIEASNEPKEGFHKRDNILLRCPEFVKIHYEVSERDAEIVATVIQWLGSNVGMSFLGMALRKCGKKIVDI